MDTEKLFSKLSSKDYNNQLEEILEQKDFSEDVKNLLLSMLYKIEASYKDYANVKRIVEDKNTYIEEIINIIRDKCKKIIIAKTGSEVAEELENSKTKFLVDKLEGSIYLMYPNERLLLYTIYKLDDKQIYLDEKYNLIRNSLSELLNNGEDINNIEVVRDFNGWNWNTLNSEIPEIATNLIYQNLIYLLGINFIKNWVHTERVIDHVKVLQKTLTDSYGKNYAEEILKQINKISILVCTDKNEREKKRLLEEKDDLQAELNRLDNKKTLLNEISTSKKEALKKIKEIDNILNDKELLQKEYVKRNEKRPEYNKILNVTHLIEILNKERRKLLSNIDENNKLLDPQHYVKIKENIESQLELLMDIELEDNEKNTKKYSYLIELQKSFIKCFNLKVEKATQRDEIIELIYMFRYYNLLFLTDNEKICDAKDIKEELSKLEYYLIKKAHELKAINIITNESVINNEIMRNILTGKTISLENIGIELKENENGLQVSIYDGDVYEKTIMISAYNKRMLIMKTNKILKIF